MTNKINIFDRKLLRNNRQRFAEKFSRCDFLHKEMAERILEKISDFEQNFDSILEISARDGYLGREIQNLKNSKFLVQTDLSISLLKTNETAAKLIMDDEFLCFKKQSFDLIVSNLNLHIINDIPNFLLQIKNCLKPNGIFIASFFGGQSLKELREVFYQIETENYGAISPRIIPFIDVKDAGILMQKAGFTDTVSEIEKIEISYINPLSLLRDLKNMGEGNILYKRSRKFFSKKLLFLLEILYQKLYSDSESRVNASFEIITITGKNNLQNI